MKKLFFLVAAVYGMYSAQAQTKNFSLYVVAEGNFGTPNGDVYKVTKTGTAPAVGSVALYQSANGSAGIDVLQDFEILGNRAILCGKGTAPIKMAITNFPGFDTIKTFTNATFGAGIQCMGKASNMKAYVSAASGPVSMIDLSNNSVNPVTDPAVALSSYASYMVPANGFMYIAIGSKIVKVDTLTNSVTATILPGIGTIAGMQYDPVRNCFWLLGKVSNVSSIVKMEPSNNDLLNTPITLTGISNAKLLRYGADKLYFISGTNVHAYSITNPVIPTTSVYTTTLAGSSFSIFYGKSFGVDPVSGDFALASAGNFAAPSTYEVIDGTTYLRIDSGAVEGRIANELILHTTTIPTWDTLPLVHVYAACDTTLTAPTASYNTLPVTGTTTSPLIYNTQGSYTIQWTYVQGTDTIHQTQLVTIADTIAPVAAVDTLIALEGNCPYTLVPPTALDNCSGVVTATTNSLTYTQGGDYVVNWTYTDAAGNTSTQTQRLKVNCTTNSIKDRQLATLNVYPNPAKEQLTINLDQYSNGIYTLSLTDMLGKKQLVQKVSGSSITIPVASLPEGIYFLQLSRNGLPFSKVQKVVISGK
ncbi:hypothetical protein DBR32_08525 [Taibaiella sp. KBW10]|uniref:T9SS type A sorting domain-containing protein n=1 Tax=Taibaiella sp. KBW10 TaxID=2153357 RepID=UPI000F5A2379|nr:T9SS type A sorting domain-containing protein [Taibaiella sp. KBW10]RQO30762.1 hypothetical protein DBR32_08525 [Taibaiella sp. KBW10]